MTRRVLEREAPRLLLDVVGEVRVGDEPPRQRTDPGAVLEQGVERHLPSRSVRLHVLQSAGGPADGSARVRSGTNGDRAQAQGPRLRMLPRLAVALDVGAAARRIRTPGERLCHLALFLGLVRRDGKIVGIERARAVLNGARRPCGPR